MSAEYVAALEASGRRLADALAAHRFDARDPVVAALVDFRLALDAAPVPDRMAALEAENRRLRGAWTSPPVTTSGYDLDADPRR